MLGLVARGTPFTLTRNPHSEILADVGDLETSKRSAKPCPFRVPQTLSSPGSVHDRDTPPLQKTRSTGVQLYAAESECTGTQEPIKTQKHIKKKFFFLLSAD